MPLSVLPSRKLVKVKLTSVPPGLLIGGVAKEMMA